MPSVNLLISPRGPVIDVRIGISRPRQDALIQAGLAVPPSVDGRLLIDTGASMTCIDPGIIQQLQLSPSGVVPIHTPSTAAGQAHDCNQYDVSLTILHPSLNRIFSTIPVVESHLAHQGIDGLFGRDILDHCILIYSGELKLCILSF